MQLPDGISTVASRTCATSAAAWPYAAMPNMIRNRDLVFLSHTSTMYQQSALLLLVLVLLLLLLLLLLVALLLHFCMAWGVRSCLDLR